MNRSVLVTGASQGLGYQIAQKHLDLGDRVFAWVIVRSEELIALEKRYGERISVVFADISNTDSVYAAGKQVESATGHLDILYHNAGVYCAADGLPLEEIDPDRLLWYYNVNAVGPVRVMKAISSLLNKGSVVINICSESDGSALCGSFCGYGYCMSKAALNMAVRIYGADIQEKGIRSLVVYPGRMQIAGCGTDADLPPEISAERILDIALNVEEIPAEAVHIDRDRNPLQW